MPVPAESPLHHVSRLVRVPRHSVLDRAHQQVSIVRQSCGKRRAVVKGELGPALALLVRRLKGLDLVPQLERLMLGLGKGNVERCCEKSR